MKALGMLIVLVLTTLPVHAMSAQSETSVTTWPMAVGFVLFFAAVFFCLTAMKRVATIDISQGNGTPGSGQ